MLQSVSYTLSSFWLEPLLPSFCAFFHTSESQSGFFFILPRRARGPNQLPVKKLPRPDGWTLFFSFHDLSHTNNPIWVSLSYSCVAVKTLERYEVQMVHCPPTECFLFTLFAIVHCVSVPDTCSCQRVCPAPKIQTRSPCSLSPIKQLGCALLCAQMRVCVWIHPNTQCLNLCKCARMRARGTNVRAAWCQLRLFVDKSTLS